MPRKPRMTALPDLAFDFGEVVFLRVLEERCPGIITGFSLRPGGVWCYSVSFAGGESDHYDFELTREYVPIYGSDDATEGE